MNAHYSYRLTKSFFKYCNFKHKVCIYKEYHTDKKENQIFLIYIVKFRVEQLQSHIWLTASSYMGKYFRLPLYIRKPFLIYDFATAPLWISLYMRKVLLSFLSVHSVCPLVGIGTLPIPLSPASVPLPPEPKGLHSPACEGLGESQCRRLEKKLCTLPTLWFQAYHTGLRLWILPQMQFQSSFCPPMRERWAGRRGGRSRRALADPPIPSLFERIFFYNNSSGIFHLRTHT